MKQSSTTTESRLSAARCRPAGAWAMRTTRITELIGTLNSPATTTSGSSGQ